jgi:hypothetical protein
VNSRWFSWYSVWKKARASLASPAPAVGQHADVAAGAEPALAAMVDDDQVDLGILLPVQQGGDHDLAHVLRQGVQRLGPVERQRPTFF